MDLSDPSKWIVHTSPTEFTLDGMIIGYPGHLNLHIGQIHELKQFKAVFSLIIMLYSALDVFIFPCPYARISLIGMPDFAESCSWVIPLALRADLSQALLSSSLPTISSATLSKTHREWACPSLLQLPGMGFAIPTRVLFKQVHYMYRSIEAMVLMIVFLT